MEGHFPRKRFGQHFLKDKHILAKIVQALNPQPQDKLVEIGPGMGALTTYVLNHVDHLEVVEIDRDLSARLEQAYPTQLTVHRADALHFDFASLCHNDTRRLRLFGNLPYNISTPLLFHFLTFAHLIQDLILMLQKEVVDRMAAAPGSDDYGRLSIMVQYHCRVLPLFVVKPDAFSPPPKVMSSVVMLKPHGENCPHPLAEDPALFARLVATAFQHRRKTLKNALGDLVSPEIYPLVAIDPQRRPETLSITEFVTLSNAVLAHFI